MPWRFVSTGSYQHLRLNAALGRFSNGRTCHRNLLYVQGKGIYVYGGYKYAQKPRLVSNLSHALHLIHAILGNSGSQQEVKYSLYSLGLQLNAAQTSTRQWPARAGLLWSC